MRTFDLEVVTPTREAFHGQVEYVQLPGVQGSFGVLGGHAPFLSILAIGAARIRTPEKERILAITGGYAEVLGNCVTVLARTAEFVEEIDGDRAERARKRSADRLAALQSGLDRDRAEASYHRALLRLNLFRSSR